LACRVDSWQDGKCWGAGILIIGRSSRETERTESFLQALEKIFIEAAEVGEIKGGWGGAIAGFYIYR